MCARTHVRRPRVLDGHMGHSRTILTILPDELHLRVTMMSARDSIVEKVSPSALRAELRRRRASVVLLDPVKLHHGLLFDVLNVAADEGTRVVLYGRPVKDTCAEVLRVSDHVPYVGLVLAYEDDESGWLDEQIKFAKPEASLPHLLNAVRVPLSRLLEPARTYAIAMFGRQRPSSANETVARLGLPARTVRRWFHAAGFRGIARLVRGIRIAGAVDRYCYGNQDLATAADLSGVGTAARLRRIAAAIMRVSIHRIGDELTPYDVAHRIASDICR